MSEVLENAARLSAEPTKDRLSALARSEDHAVFVAESAAGVLVGWLHVFATTRLSHRFYPQSGLVRSRIKRFTIDRSKVDYNEFTVNR